MITKIKNLTTHSGFRRYGANTVWLFIEKIVRMVVGLVIGVWVARYLGPDDFGILNYVINYVGLLAIIGTFGLDGIIIRELVKDRAKRDIILGTSFWLRILGSLLVTFLILLTVPLTSSDTTTEFYMMIIAFSTFFNATIVIDYFFKAEVLSKKSVIVNVVALLGSSIFKVLFIFLQYPLTYFIALIVLENIILAIGYIMIYSKSGHSLLDWKFDKQMASELIRHGWPLMISSMMVTIYTRADVIMIQEFLDSTAVGIYSAATRISVAWYFIPGIISTSLFPALINAKKMDEFLYQERFRKLLALMIWMGLLIAIPMTFFSDWLIVLLYGQVYEEAGLILAIHIWAAVFVFISSATNQWYVNENLQFISMIYTGIGAMLNVVLNYYLIPAYGIVGASIATVFSYFLVTTICPLLHRKTRGNVGLIFRGMLFMQTERKL